MFYYLGIKILLSLFYWMHPDFLLSKDAIVIIYGLSVRILDKIIPIFTLRLILDYYFAVIIGSIYIVSARAGIFSELLFF